jgi:hypothetical protein
VPLEEVERSAAETMRTRILAADVPPSAFRAAVMAVPPEQRDPWIDAVLGIDDVPADTEELPLGCAPYLPCPVQALLDAIDLARIAEGDVFVDLGSGLGRAAITTHLLTGASVIGLEIQSHLATASRELAARLSLPRCAFVHGDVPRLAAFVPIGTVFFFYCPFSGTRLEKVLDELEPAARTKPIRVCAVDMTLPHRSWLVPLTAPSAATTVLRSTLCDPRERALESPAQR